MCGISILTDSAPLTARAASSKPAASMKAGRGGNKRRHEDDDFSPAHDGQKKQGRHFHGIRQRVGGKWAAELRDPYKGARVWLGTFNTADDAARAYDAEARRLFDSKAKLNFPAASARRGSPRTAPNPRRATPAATPAMPKKLRYDDEGSGGGCGSMLDLAVDEPAFCPFMLAQMAYSVGYGYNYAAEAVEEEVDDMGGLSLWSFDDFPGDGAMLGRFP